MQGLFCWFTWFSTEFDKNVDYKEWLGEEEGGPFNAHSKQKAPTIVCNHLGWLEILGLIASPFHPGFVPTIGYKDAPILAPIIAGL